MTFAVTPGRYLEAVVSDAGMQACDRPYLVRRRYPLWGKIGARGGLRCGGSTRVQARVLELAHESGRNFSPGRVFLQVRNLFPVLDSFGEFRELQQFDCCRVGEPTVAGVGEAVAQARNHRVPRFRCFYRSSQALC